MQFNQLNEEQKAVYACLCYFDVFQHPLRFAEICEFVSLPFSDSKVHSVLDELLHLQLIRSDSGFYLLKNASGNTIQKRLSAEQRFQAKQTTIRRFARFVARFPFVQSVAISGSCSKGLLDEDGDVDYFIITSPGRLWLCRSLLIGFKKLFLFNSKKYFCVNYFLSADQLEIPDRNVFVACEISTLMPVSNKALFDKYLEHNKWVEEFLPNKKAYNDQFLKNQLPKRPLSKLLEVTFSGKLGDALDRRFFKFTLNTWEKKFADFSKEDFDLNMRSKKNVSKHHPRGFQKKVLQEFENRMSILSVITAE
ncbi:MAG: nucleotidyltransferase domain-containing protein [Bacteroidia bacterium]|jgi:hypothetical protein|nr:nucleotidyltransferase domain-containing protein [Bacteroidia bacterium]